MRLDKFVATNTSLSRKEAKKSIKAGKVIVDGVPIRDERYAVSPTQEVVVEGNPVMGKEHVYLMLNKPKGVLSATKDAKEPTVIDFVQDIERELFPVGRLDKDTEGFLLLTDDGLLAHRLLSPAYHVPKTYYVEYSGVLCEDAVALVERGLDIGEKKLTKPGSLRLLSEGSAELTIEEGKFHQVKRMIDVLGGKVTYLKRISMGGILLDDMLAPGQYRELTEQEYTCLLEQVEKK